MNSSPHQNRVRGGLASERAMSTSAGSTFYRAHRLVHQGENLFEGLSGFLFYVKDRQGRFVDVNWNLVRNFGARNKEEILGKRDEDFLPDYLVETYAKDDRRVLERGEEVINKIELLTNSSGLVDWYITNKAPLVSEDGEIMALAGVTRDFKKGTAGLQPQSELFVVIEYIRKHYAHKIVIPELAKMINLSVSAFERRFKKHFHVPPLQYIKKVRVHEACHLLNHSNQSLAEIAMDCGFCDQSHFTKEFIRVMHTTPSAYRKNHGRVNPEVP